MKKLIFGISLFFSVSVFGQGVTVFESDVKSDKADKSDSDYKNALKFGVFNLLRGEFTLFYESKLNSLLSVEAGLGMTFYNTVNKIGTPVVNEFLDMDYESSSGNTMDEFTKTNLSVGPAFQGLFKFFPKRNAMSGFYLGLNARYSRFSAMHNAQEAISYYKSNSLYDASGNFSYDEVSVTNSSSESFNAYTAYTDFLLVIGTERLNYEETVYFEWYVSVGLRNIQRMSIDKDVVSSIDGGNLIGNITYSEGFPQASISPMFAGGLKIGGFW